MMMDVDQTAILPSSQSRELQMQRLEVKSVFTRAPIYDAIFSEASPAGAILISRTCRDAWYAEKEFKKRAFNINRHLQRFFANPKAFRSLQARTGTLISGSNALQFLDRTYYPESDLDLFVHPGHSREIGLWLMRHEGYAFAPSRHESQEGEPFEAVVPEIWDGLAERYNPRADSNVHNESSYGIQCLEAIYTFWKEDEGGKVNKIQIITASNTPLQCIVSFHSTCVMNLITFDSAYSLYPRATFEERRTLALKIYTLGQELARSKYVDRGWRLQNGLWPHDERNPKLPFYLGTLRTMGDKLSWVIPLDTTGVDMRPPLTELSPIFHWDPVIHNSWRLSKNVSHDLAMDYCLAKSTILRYNYMIADEQYFKILVHFMASQGRTDHFKRGDLSKEEIYDSITWWDAELPGFHESYLIEKAEKERLDQKKVAYEVMYE